jgi:RNA polymerase sigma-70 factor, ECF subfamily
MRVAKRPSPAIQAVDEDEADLVRRSSAGDRDAFRLLFERHHARVHRYAVLRVGDPEAASDIVQEVFTAVWKGLPRFQPEHPGSFPAWMFGIARNIVGSYHRTAHRSVAVSDDLLPEGSVEFEGTLVTQRLVTEALEKLAADQRDVLALRFLVGLPISEVAAIMGRSDGAVTALQLRALEKLRRLMGDAL